MRTKEWLKQKRSQLGITQKELAEKIGLTSSAIELIEQGRRLGSVDTWERIENFFSNYFGPGPRLSYNSDDLIEELKKDIEEFGENYECILVYKVIDDHIFFTNYDFITKEKPFNSNEELEKDESYIKTTFKYALEVFEKQNEIV